MSSKPSTSRESKPSIEAGEEQRSVANPAREEEIKRRAYEIYLERGEEPGRDVEDWLQAERELASHEIVPLEE
jgi:hypothetical protein